MAHLHQILMMLRDMTTGLPDFSTEQSGVCRGCALGKYNKIAFSSSDNISKGVLELIHLDLCGPMSSASFTSFEYYITFIDDFSRKNCIYFLRKQEIRGGLASVPRVQSSCGEPDRKEDQGTQIR